LAFVIIDLISSNRVLNLLIRISASALLIFVVIAAIFSGALNFTGGNLPKNRISQASQCIRLRFGDHMPAIHFSIARSENRLDWKIWEKVSE
jgi:hypothetical protein